MTSAINRRLPVSSVTCFSAIIVVSMITWSACEDFCTTPRPPNCSCIITKDAHILQLQCPTLAVEVDFQNHTMTIGCSNNTSEFSVLSDMHIGLVDTLTVQQCRLFPVHDIGVYGTCRLTLIDPDTRGSVSPQMIFSGLTNVTHLTIQTTDITIFSDAFIEMPKLSELTLVFNNTALTKTTFCSAPNIYLLELTNNNLAYLQPDIFHCLTKLKYLELNGNIRNSARSVSADTQSLKSLATNSNLLSDLPPGVFMELEKFYMFFMKSYEPLSLPHNVFKRNIGLKVININNNVITEKTLPSGFLANLTELIYVRITNNRLNNLPQDLFWGSSLIYDVSLTRNNFTSLPPLLFRDCKQLHTLQIDFNQITDLPSHLFSETLLLEKLSLSNNRLTNIENIGFHNLQQLKYLDLSNNRIQNVVSFTLPENLKSIYMRNNFLTSVPPYMPTTLERIELSNNSLTSIYADWNEMEYLKHLNLSHNQISRIQTAHLHFRSNENISVDLSCNKINKIDFSDVDTVYIIPIESEKHYVNSLKRRYIYIAGNPFYDNCQVYSLVELKWKTYNSVIFFITDNLQPIKQVSLVEYIPLTKLTCLLTELDNPTCPEQCSCLYRFSGNTLLVNCDQRNYSSMPKAVPDVKFSSHTLLNLTRNNIKAVKPPLGLGYHKVTKYILSNNEINEIDLTAFSPRLQVLEINGNLITQFNKSSIEFLKNATNLIQLSLHRNPWKCDCTTEDTVDLIEFFYSAKKIKTLEIATCDNGKYVWNISQAELCPVDSQIFVIDLSFTVLAFGLLIGIIGFYYRFQKEIKIWLYSHRCCLWFISEEELDRDKVYDAFVSYAYPDEDFVVDHLIPGLENGPITYRLCVHQRDWIPGEMIPTQITRSVEESRRTIIVLSEHFLNSTWGKMEFCVAHTQALSERRVRVIVVMYGDIGKTNKLDAELRAYLTMNTYVKWGDPFFWEKLRYALPRRL